jgi:CubicO group peptidase (beta-lactamase class C family)
MIRLPVQIQCSLRNARVLLIAAVSVVPLSAAVRAAETATKMPPGVVIPEEALRDPTYSDPVFWWRMTSRPPDVYEPDAYFYWPDAVIRGAPAAFLPAASPGRTSIDAAALRAAADWAAARKSGALIVVHRGTVQLETYWNGMRPDELVNGRAITRSVTPMLLGFAVAAGKVSLDDPIGKFITEWRDDPRGRITVQQLGQQVSGLEVAPQLPMTVIAGNKDLCLAYCGDVVRAALRYEYAYPPGSRFEYAQENMQLLALVIERALGMPIQELLSARVWRPIGAADATFQMDRPGGVARVMCCMRATPRDWVRLGVLVMQDGRWQGKQVLPAGWARTMATPSPRNPSHGLGLWLGSPYVALRSFFEGQPGLVPQSEPFLASDVRTMEGGGFRVIYMVPSEQLVIFRHGPAVSNWDHAFLVNSILRGLPAHRRHATRSQ